MKISFTLLAAFVLFLSALPVMADTPQNNNLQKQQAESPDPHAVTMYPLCGDGFLDLEEECDDGNNSPGDGCDEACVIEHGYECTGEPSICTSTCGDGLVAGDEGCDDGNNTDGDGCSSGCQVEPGWNCSGEPSVCADDVCGDGVVEGGEACDDGNSTDGDGCDSGCNIESGWLCTGEPSVCSVLVCGDVNCDGSVNIGDAVYLINYVFQQESPAPCAGCP